MCGCGAAVQLWSLFCLYTSRVDGHWTSKTVFLATGGSEEGRSRKETGVYVAVLRELLKPQKFVSLEGDQF